MKLFGRMETYMRRDLSDYRPILLRGREDHLSLWVNIDGNPLAYTTMYQLIRKVTASWGHKTAPKKMRHACATLIMNADPRRLQAASAALAHRGTSSVNQVYDRSGNLGAQSIWLKMQAEIATTAQKKRRRTRRKRRRTSDHVCQSSVSRGDRLSKVACRRRAAIYARFSTDMQRDASIDDQVRTCRALAAREGLEVVEVYADYALSGGFGAAATVASKTHGCPRTPDRR